MDIHSINEYLKELEQRYFQCHPRKEKTSILNEYCNNTHQNRKYVISKIRSFLSSGPKERRKRKQIYDGYVKAALAKIWEIFDYFRYDTDEELILMNCLYEKELRLYRNFFSPVMKLIKKERIRAKVKRKYDVPKTPHQRLIESGQIPEEQKKKLEALYLKLNPAELKRKIEEKTHMLYRAYEEKKRTRDANPHKKQRPRLARNYMIQQSQIGLGR